MHSSMSQPINPGRTCIRVSNLKTKLFCEPTYLFIMSLLIFMHYYIEIIHIFPKNLIAVLTSPATAEFF